jgi:hypothetical protein
MFKFKGVLSLLTMSLLLIGSPIRAEIWDLGYNKPVVEEVIEEPAETVEPAEPSASAMADAHEKEQNQVVKPASKASSIGKISTARNTFGVETVERSSFKIYLSPTFGFNSVLGINSLTVTPLYSFGGRLGFLIAESLMIEGGFTRALINTSAPVISSTGYQPLDVFEYKQNIVDVGAKLFFLGRESRLRPFVAGGFGYAISALNYTPAYQVMMGNASDFQIKQFQGVGQLGAEFAITRAIVASATFQVNGVFSSKTQSSQSQTIGSSVLEPSRIDAGNSLSHSATYAGTLGLGVYF